MVGAATVAVAHHPTPVLPSSSFATSRLGLAREGDTGTTTRPLFDVCLPSPSEQQAPPPPDHDISVAYALADDTAKAPADYLPASGRLTIPKGTTPGCATLSAQIVGNTLPQADRAFKVLLSDPQGATFADGSTAGTTAVTAEGVIVDDDGSTSVGGPTGKMASGWATPVALEPIRAVLLATRRDAYQRRVGGDQQHRPQRQHRHRLVWLRPGRAQAGL